MMTHKEWNALLQVLAALPNPPDDVFIEMPGGVQISHDRKIRVVNGPQMRFFDLKKDGQPQAMLAFLSRPWREDMEYAIVDVHQGGDVLTHHVPVWAIDAAADGGIEGAENWEQEIGALLNEGCLVRQIACAGPRWRLDWSAEGWQRFLREHREEGGGKPEEKDAPTGGS